MTQAAVSYAIRGLEEQLGVQLFQRRHRAGAADRGRRALPCRRVARPVAYPQIGRGSARAGGRRPCHAVGLHRLCLVLDDAAAAASSATTCPDIDLRIQTADRDLDLVAERHPARRARRRHRADWPDYQIAADRRRGDLSPSPAPAISRVRHCRRPSPIWLSHRLIHLEEPYREAAELGRMVPARPASAVAPPRAACVINDYVPGDPGRHGGPGHRAWLAASGRTAAGDAGCWCR